MTFSLAAVLLASHALAATASKDITEAPIGAVPLSQLIETQKSTGFVLPFPGPQYLFSLVFDQKLDGHVLIQGLDGRDRLALSVLDRNQMVPFGEKPAFHVLIGRAPNARSHEPGTDNHLYIYDADKRFVSSTPLKAIFDATYASGHKISHPQDRTVLYAPTVKGKDGSIIIRESVQLLRLDDVDTYWSSVFALDKLKDHVNWFTIYNDSRIGLWLDSAKTVRFYEMPSAIGQRLPPLIPSAKSLNDAFKSN